MTQRDGALVSLWQGNADNYQPTNAPADITYDVIIAGGGITGLSLALQLQSRGLQCLVLEAKTICFGTTGGTTAHLNSLMDTPYTTIIKNFGEDGARKVAEAAKDALALIRENIANYGIDCTYEAAAAYLFSQDDAQTKELQEIYEACTKVGLDISYSSDIPVPVPFEKAIQVSGQGKFNPVQYVYGLAKAFESKGGVIMQHCRVMEHAHRNEETTVHQIIAVGTSTGQLFYSRSLVYATHIALGVNVLHFECAPYRSYAMAVKLTDNGYPSELAYDMYDPYHYYRTQKVDDELFLIVGGEDHKTAHEANTNKCFIALEAHIRKYFNVDKIAYKWSSQYFEPADGLPYIGNLPGDHANVYVATGYGGNGMTYSHVAALELSDMIINSKNRYDNLFNPSRLKPIAGFKNIIKENADVVKEMVGKWFAHADMESLSNLAKGEGKIVEYDKEKIALHKDNNGMLHAVDPACTHVKCRVSWNDAEQSWDCPCHGARYDADGNVLTAPAHLALKKITLAQKEA